MTDTIQLDGVAFYKKVQKMMKTWNQVLEPQDALLLVMSKLTDGAGRLLTSDFFVWLLNYEFSDTILLITQEKIVFAVSPKKKQLLDSMEQPMNYEGPQLEIIVREAKQDNTAQVIDQVLSHVKASSAKIGIFLKDKIDGDLTQACIDAIDKKGFQKIDMKDFMDKANQVKIDVELDNMRVASNFLQWTFSKIINEVEDIIDGEKQVKHTHIQKKIESLIEKDDLKDFLNKNPKVQCNFLEFPLPVLIQSGESFNINKFNVQSDSNKLNYETVYINICGKYKDMTAMASRTLLVNPQDDQKNAYIIANDALDILIKNLKTGEPIKNSYLAAKKYIQSKSSDLANKIHSNFGFGIGSQFKEESLLINENNEIEVKPGMVFHTRITLSEVSKKLSRAIIAIGDTVMIGPDGQAQILTNKIQRKYNEISYSLDVSNSIQLFKQQEDEEEEEEKAKTATNGETQDKKKKIKQEEEDILKQAKTDLITRTRLRQKNVAQHSNEEQRKKSQQELLKKKVGELRERYENGEIFTAAKKEKVKKMESAQAYSNEKQFPKDMKPGQLYVDKNHDAILVPFRNNQFVPFHVSTIKNVSTNNEGQFTFLRLNFHVPGGSSLQFPTLQQNSLFVKELTLKCNNNGPSNHLINAFKQIKELIKSTKVKDTEELVRQEADELSQEELITVKGKKDILENLVIRPNIVGKKTIGNLEIHQNGVRFVSQKGHNIDITFSNVKHAFFQPCAADELIVIIHFHLKTPILVGTKKVTDVQFFKESGAVADDIDIKAARKKLNDMDELEQEERERQQKIRLNNRFANYVKQIEAMSEKGRNKIEFDIPFEGLEFFGCPYKSVVKVRPTKNCLIAISEFPFFVVDINDIEIVHFERVQFGIKNFDMAIIFKDFQTFKRVNAIPIEYIEEIKSYFDEIGIIYSESVVPMNWTNVLQQIREDFEVFLEDGAWSFLQDEDDDEAQGEEESEEDEEFEVVESDLDEEEDEESDFSDEESDYSDSEDYSDELSDEGMSWDELEKQAEEEDRKAVVRRQVKDVPQQNKRRPASSGRR